MAASGPHISIAAEPLFSVGSLAITNSIFTSLLVSTILVTFAIIVRLSLKKTNKPTGLQNFAEWIVEALIGLVQSITNNERKTKEFLPWVASFFLFILLNNWLGLFPGVGTIGITVDESGEKHAALQTQLVSIPTEQTYAATPVVEEHAEETTEEASDIHVEEGAPAEAASHSKFVPIFRPGTADLNTTLALALLTVFLIQFYGVKHLGLSYFKKYINFSSPIMFFVGILELVSEVSKIISFAFRLFGNVFAGEVLLVVISFLLPVVAPLPFYGLEVFVGFIQALVFAMLSLVLYNLATHGHDEH
jgi:F-type H+-transporting ATPase subunit a